MILRQSLAARASAAAAAVFVLTVPGWASAQQPASPAAAASAPAAGPLQGAQLIGQGRLAAYRKEGSVLVVVPAASIGKPFLWYTEVVGMPAGVVTSKSLEVNNLMARFERQGALLHVRDLSTVQNRRSGTPAGEATPKSPSWGYGSVQGSAPNDPKLRPIDVALTTLETGPLVASFPIKAAQPDGSLVVDVTAAFSNDIPAVTGRVIVALTNTAAVATDPYKSYIEKVRVAGENLNIRTHLTFLTSSPTAAYLGPQPTSMVLGHSWLFLPDKPMAARPADSRVGFFSAKYTEYESDTGAAMETRTLISRFRLEKANPQAAVSDPVKPITYYIGPGVPERWRPYIAAGVLQWLPVFEAAGFSNAIRVRNAPTPQEDPNWSVEDVGINVIRWVPEERANAMGPHVVDPRSGETLAAHILVWPSVIDVFSNYYWALFGGGVDPAAAKLPLPIEKAGAILAYAVAHEVGHTLGLMHNQLASTAHTVAQLRDPKFASRFGPNSSIMAYGRFNYVAQPGDGVTQLWGVAGPYDYAAIKYGYGVFGTDPTSERKALADFAKTFMSDRRLFWGSEESGELISRFGRDPRVQTENVGVERVEATRLGVANILRSMDRLDAATAGDAELYRSVYGTALSRHVGLLKSVKRMIAAALPPLGAQEGPLAILVPAAEQRKAVNYLLGEGAASLEPYARPAVVERVNVYGGYRSIDRLQADLVADVLNGANVALLESLWRREPTAYSPLDLGRDVNAVVWGMLKTRTPTTATQRALQRGYVSASNEMLQAWAKRGASEVADAKVVEAIGSSTSAARLLVESGDDTLFMPWLRASLASLRKDLEAAALNSTSEIDRLHYAEMAVQMGRLLKIGMS